MAKAYKEIVDFIAAGSTSEEVAEWVPSQASQERVAELLMRNKSSTLSPEEQTELNHYIELEHLMRLAKARARHTSSD